MIIMIINDYNHVSNFRKKLKHFIFAFASKIIFQYHNNVKLCFKYSLDFEKKINKPVKNYNKDDYPNWLHDISPRRHFTPGHFTPVHFTLRTFHPTYISPHVRFTPRTFHPTYISPHVCFTPRTFHPTYVSPQVRFTPRTFHSKDMSLRIKYLGWPNNTLYKPVAIIIYN